MLFMANTCMSLYEQGMYEKTYMNLVHIASFWKKYGKIDKKFGGRLISNVFMYKLHNRLLKSFSKYTEKIHSESD